MAQITDSKRTFSDGKYAYQFMAYRHLNRMGQILLVTYIVFSVFRAGCYAAMMTVLGPWGRAAIYPGKKLYWCVRFQWQKRCT